VLGLPVSVLDFGIAQEGTQVDQAVADVLATARHADHLGFRRFWVAEHHGSQRVSDNRMIPPSVQRFMAGRMRARVRTTPADHMPMVTAPAAVTAIVLEAVREVASHR